MTDEFEVSRSFLELFYFTLSLINESMDPLQYFKSDFIILQKPFIEKLVAQFPEQTENQIYQTPQYKQLVSKCISDMSKIIGTLKQSGLWVPQGSYTVSNDAIELIEQVLNSKYIDADQVLILRSVKINQLIYSPELTLYYNACISCTQSPIIIVRLCGYALLRLAPVIHDLRHLFNVFKVIISIWNSSPVSFEFCAVFHLLLERFSKHRPSQFDANEYDLINQMLEDIHISPNFETLMCFDPTLKWMYKCLSTESITKVFDTSLKSLESGNSGDFCIICHSLSNGIGSFDIFLKAVETALEKVAEWAYPIKKEARTALGVLPLRRLKDIQPEVLDIVAPALNQQPKNAQPSFYIFAEFLISYYNNTNSPINETLVHGLINILTSSTGQSLPNDVKNIIISICSNPVRLMKVLELVPSQKSDLIALLNNVKYKSTLASILCNTNSYSMLSESEVKNAFKMLREKSLSCEEIEYNSYSKRLMIDLPYYSYLRPDEFKKIAEKLTTITNEEMIRYVIELCAVVTFVGRHEEIYQSILEYLPENRYKCQHTELTDRIRAAINRNEKNNHYKLKDNIDSSLYQFLTIDSASNTAVALLFEHVIWSEGGLPLVIFKRLSMRPADWASFAISSLFASIVSDTDSVKEMINMNQKSPSNLVWVSIILFSRVAEHIMECLAAEDFENMIRHVFYTNIDFSVTNSEMERFKELDTKYQDTLQQIFDVIVGSAKY